GRRGMVPCRALHLPRRILRRKHACVAGTAARNAAHRRVELRFRVHQPAWRSCRAPDRERRPEGPACGWRGGFGQACQFHHQRGRGQRPRHRNIDRTRAAGSRAPAWSAPRARVPHRRRGTQVKLTHDRSRLKRITDASQFGKVAVLFGGQSTEREISLISGRAVLAALQRRGIDATGVDPRDEPLHELPGRGFDRAFIVLHGPGGEDGSTQGALEVLGLPYTGSGVLGSALAMDKLRTKRLAAALGVMTAESEVLRTVADCERALDRLGLPLIIKPATQGSSVGMSKVTPREQMAQAFRAAEAEDDVEFSESHSTGVGTTFTWHTPRS